VIETSSPLHHLAASAIAYFAGMLVSLVVVTLVSAAMCRQRGARSAFPCFDKG